MKNFKAKWKPNEIHPWTEFSPEQLNKTSLSNLTKDFLINGFPESSAPFLSFGIENYDSKFITIAEYYSDYQLDSKTKNYWIFGSDGNGNPICIDSNSKDEILLLDHEQSFEPIQKINRNVIELSQCLLEYKQFVELINSEFGEGGFFESKFTITHLNELKKRFEQINKNIFSESDFWNGEMEMLIEETK